MTEQARKLVRARPKLPEYLPEWAKCCQAAVDEIAGFGEFVGDLLAVYQPIGGFATCGYCGEILDTGPYLTGVDGRAMPISILDLDEGSLS